mmetsp:Transcript_30137/g.66025  ORF Transcript_30137/g.66025 Transcript_30137/m.66025 type:complete len:283 (+) Transcript_30137:551-1399(+)
MLPPAAALNTFTWMWTEQQPPPPVAESGGHAAPMCLSIFTYKPISAPPPVLKRRSCGGGGDLNSDFIVWAPPSSRRRHAPLTESGCAAGLSTTTPSCKQQTSSIGELLTSCLRTAALGIKCELKPNLAKEAETGPARAHRRICGGKTCKDHTNYAAATCCSIIGLNTRSLMLCMHLSRLVDFLQLCDDMLGDGGRSRQHVRIDADAPAATTPQQATQELVGRACRLRDLSLPLFIVRFLRVSSVSQELIAHPQPHSLMFTRLHLLRHRLRFPLRSPLRSPLA